MAPNSVSCRRNPLKNVTSRLHFFLALRLHRAQLERQSKGHAETVTLTISGVWSNFVFLKDIDPRERLNKGCTLGSEIGCVSPMVNALTEQITPTHLSRYVRNWLTALGHRVPSRPAFRLQRFVDFFEGLGLQACTSVARASRMSPRSAVRR